MIKQDVVTGASLERFRDMNGNKPKVPWKERSEVIKETFPSVVELDWEKAFKVDPALMGKLIGDILKIDVAEPGKPGKRPTPSPQDGGEAQYRRLIGEDHSHLPFHQALKTLARGRSVRSLAHSTNISKSKVHGLLNGDVKPTVQDMEEFAILFKKNPEYFWEYRVAYIGGIVYQHLNYSSEASVILMNRIRALIQHNEKRRLNK